MRKKIINQAAPHAITENENWLDITHLAQVELTSEDASCPIENALTINEKPGWRASETGKQTIRIIFDIPQPIQRIYLHFEEKEQSRTQEFTLEWTPDNDQSLIEIVRQQYNFSPGSSAEEKEDYTVNLKDVKVLELTITPDISGGDALASITSLLLA